MAGSSGMLDDDAGEARTRSIARGRNAQQSERHVQYKSLLNKSVALSIGPEAAMHNVGDSRTPPASIDLLGIEPLEEHARRLAALLAISPSRRGRAAHLTMLRRHTATLRRVYTSLSADVAHGEPSSPAAEWLLDNFHIVLAALHDIQHDLPASFFRRLPWIAADEFAGLPRVYAMARELIRCSAGRLDSQRLHRFVTAFQSITPLTMGELWAWPSLLKLVLVEHVRNRADVMATSRAHRLDADRLVDTLGARIRT